MATGASVFIDVRRKDFGENEALFVELSIQIPAGQVVALLGPSGVGKSTLLRMVAGIDSDFKGSLIIDGAQPDRGGVPGFVFQDPRLLPWKSAIGNLLAVKPDLDVGRTRQLFADLGLSGEEDKLPAELSGGMQRRVSLARALAVQPKLLLLDEPFVSLDRKLAQELRELLVQVIRDYQPTLLIVTHDARDAAELADRVITLSGRPAKISNELMIHRKRCDRDRHYINSKTAEIENDRPSE